MRVLGWGFVLFGGGALPVYTCNLHEERCYSAALLRDAVLPVLVNAGRPRSCKHPCFGAPAHCHPLNAPPPPLLSRIRSSSTCQVAGGGDELIHNTVRRLQPGDAAAFLRAAVQRLQSAPARGEQLAAWISAVLLHHTGYLVGAGGELGSLLGHLYQLVRVLASVPLCAGAWAGAELPVGMDAVALLYTAHDQSSPLA